MPHLEAPHLRHRFLRDSPWLLLIAVLLILTGLPGPAGADPAVRRLATQSATGPDAMRHGSHQADTSINRANVGRLVTKWVFTTGGDVSAEPAVANGVVYFPDWAGNFYALQARTGRVLWSHQISDWTGISGDYSRVAPAIKHGRIILGDQGGALATYSSAGLSGPGARVMAVNARNGNLEWVTQVDSFPAAEITGAAVIFKGIVYQGVSSIEEGLASNPAYPCCSFQGSVVALDEKTGQLIWQSHDVPSAPANPGGYTGGAVWGSKPVPDGKRGLLYVGTGNNYTVPADVAACIATAETNNQDDSVCNNVDNYGQDYFDSVLAFDLKTGALQWSYRAEGYDASTDACDTVPPGVTWCPSPNGPDYDFGAGPNFFMTSINKKRHDVVGIGQKSGIYWALDPANGSVLWSTLVGPASPLGGIEWGTATDSHAIYVPISNYNETVYSLQPSGVSANGGSWGALDPSSGNFLWQVATPGACTGAAGASGGCMALGAPTVANGIVYVGSMDQAPGDPTMFALDALTGEILWSFAPGSSVLAAPAIKGNTIYWGSGYSHGGVGTGNNKLFAFTPSRTPAGH